jgi:hypothetical protein
MTLNFQEKQSMKKMMLATLALVMLFSVASTPAFAAATLYNFTFRDTSGNAYCDGMFVYLYKGAGSKTLVDGQHINGGTCAGTTYVNGFKAGIAPLYQYNGLGANLIIADTTIPGVSLMYLVNPVYSTWTLWESGGGGGEFIVNYGTFVNGTTAVKKGSKGSALR